MFLFVLVLRVWLPSLGTSWLNISSSARIRSISASLYILLIDILGQAQQGARKQSTEEEEEAAAKKMLPARSIFFIYWRKPSQRWISIRYRQHERKAILFLRCLQIRLSNRNLMQSILTFYSREKKKKINGSYLIITGALLSLLWPIEGEEP